MTIKSYLKKSSWDHYILIYKKYYYIWSYQHITILNNICNNFDSNINKILYPFFSKSELEYSKFITHLFLTNIFIFRLFLKLSQKNSAYYELKKIDLISALGDHLLLHKYLHKYYANGYEFSIKQKLYILQYACIHNNINNIKYLLFNGFIPYPNILTDIQYELNGNVNLFFFDIAKVIINKEIELNKFNNYMKRYLYNIYDFYVDTYHTYKYNLLHKFIDLIQFICNKNIPIVITIDLFLYCKKNYFNIHKCPLFNYISTLIKNNY